MFIVNNKMITHAQHIFDGRLRFVWHVIDEGMKDRGEQQHADSEDVVNQLWMRSGSYLSRAPQSIRNLLYCMTYLQCLFGYVLVFAFEHSAMTAGVKRSRVGLTFIQ